MLDGKVSDDVEYLSAIEGKTSYVIAQANALTDAKNMLTEQFVLVPVPGRIAVEAAVRSAFHGRLAMQTVSVAAALVPFLEHDGRQPRIDGRQHAAPGRADAAFAEAAGRYGIERAVARDWVGPSIALRGGVIEQIGRSPASWSRSTRQKSAAAPMPAWISTT
uniref:hypothetical protein n=1 Tax=Massilia oculi TaxID=945844 RepID=UPI0036D3DCA9